MRQEFYNIANPDLDLCMVNCGYEDCIDHFVSLPTIRDYYLIHYITKGSGYYETAGQKIRVSAGDIFVIYPGQIVQYNSPDAADTWSFCWVGFSGSRAKEHLCEAGISSYTKSAVDALFYRHIMDCLAYVEQNPKNISQLRLNICVLSCLFALTINAEGRSDCPEEHVQRAINYIEFNYMKGITVSDVCTCLNLDRTYFYRIFKKHTGMSPEQYIMHCRVKKSAELLRCSSYSVSAIASFVGVRDVYYFSRLFRKIMDMSPTEYRKQQIRP